MLVPKCSDKHGCLFGLSYFQVCIVCGCSLRESGPFRFGSVARTGCDAVKLTGGLIIRGHRRETGNKSHTRESSGTVLPSPLNVPVNPGRSQSDCWMTWFN